MRKILYQRVYYPLNFPADGPMTTSSTPQAIGPLMAGIRTTKLIDGRKVRVVILQTGEVVPLSELMIVPDRRKEEREDGRS